MPIPTATALLAYLWLVGNLAVVAFGAVAVSTFGTGRVTDAW